MCKAIQRLFSTPLYQQRNVFETKETASPGFSTQLHPQLMRKQDMKDTLLGELKSIELNKEE
eukprot:5235366-Ditylum_brightwellii.AAC.2